MKRTILTLAGLGLVATLAACSPKAEQKAAAPAASAGADNMAGMSTAPAAAITAKATGTVTAVDPATGVITIDHAPILEAQWPAMTMGFNATPALAQTVKAGDKVAFDLTIKDGAGEITALHVQ